MDSIRKIIREEIFRIIKEVDADPVKLAQNMVSSNEEQVKNLQDELKYRQADARVQGLPKEEKKAREERVNYLKKSLELAQQELEMAKSSQINAVQMQQMQMSQSDDNSVLNSQSQTQVQTQV